MNIQSGVLLVMALAIASCASNSMRGQMQQLPLPPERVVQKGYSVVPPDEPGWALLARSLEVLVLGKRASDPDENFVVRGFVRVLPPLGSEEEFVGFAKSILVAEGASRYKIVSQQAKPVTLKGQPCIRTDTVMEDHGGIKRSSRADSMVLEAFALLCKHPNKTNGVLVAYSHRFYKENRAPDSATKAQKIFDSIEFSEL